MSMHEDNKHITRRAVLGSLGAGTAVAFSRGATGAADEPAKKATSAQALADRFDQLASLPFPEGQPTKDTVQALKDELLFQRATQAYLWAMPAVTSLGMQVGSEPKSGLNSNHWTCS